jgi:Asp/Glu/hydantoin racemase
MNLKTMKIVVAVHTAMPMVEPTKELFAKYLPQVRLINIVDDSLIQDVISANEVTDLVKKRLNSYYVSAIDAGADVIFNTCSSVGDVALVAKELINVPLIKIDDAMAEEAVKKYSRIGVLATLSTTLCPTVRLLQLFAKLFGKEIAVTEGLAKGAFQAVIAGDRETHDQLIIEAAVQITEKVDAFVLAQGSMARLEEQLATITGKPVLSSPERGVLEVKRVIDSLE